MTDRNAEALAELLGISLEMVRAIDHNHRSWESLLDTAELLREDRDLQFRHKKPDRIANDRAFVD